MSTHQVIDVQSQGDLSYVTDDKEDETATASSLNKGGRKYFNTPSASEGEETSMATGPANSGDNGSLHFSSPSRERITNEDRPMDKDLPPRPPSPSPRSVADTSNFATNNSNKQSYQGTESGRSDEDIVNSIAGSKNKMMSTITMTGASQGPTPKDSEYDVAGILGNLSAIGNSEENRLAALRPRPSTSKEKSSSSPSPIPPLSSSSSGRMTPPRFPSAGPPPRHQHKRSNSGEGSSGGGSSGVVAAPGHHVRRATTGTGGETSELTDASILKMFTASPGDKYSVSGKLDVALAHGEPKLLTLSKSGESEDSLNSVTLHINNVDVVMKDGASRSQRPPRARHTRKSSSDALLPPSSSSPHPLRHGNVGGFSAPNTPPPTPILRSRGSSDSNDEEDLDVSSSNRLPTKQKHQQPSSIFRSRESSPTPLSTIDGTLRTQRHRVTFSSENLVQLYKVATADDADKIAKVNARTEAQVNIPSSASDSKDDTNVASAVPSGVSLANLLNAPEPVAASKETDKKKGDRQHRRARTVMDVSTVSNPLLMATSSVDSSGGALESSVATSTSKAEPTKPKGGLKAFLHKHAKTATSTTLGTFLSRGNASRQPPATKEEVLDQQFIKLEGLIQKYGTGDHPMVLKKWNCIGNIQFYYGMHEKAFKSYSEALRGFRGVYGESHHMVALTLFHRATVQCRMGEFDDAIVGYQSALQIWRNVFGADSLEIGKVLHYLGQAYLWKDQIEDAQEALDKALHIQTDRLGKDHVEVARTLGLLAQVHMKLEEADNSGASENHGAKALMLYKEALRMKCVTVGRHHMSTIYAMFDVARCYTQQQQQEQQGQQSQIVVDGGRSQLQTALTMYGDALYIQKSLSINLPVGSDELRLAQREMAHTLHTMSFVHRRLGQFREEARELQEALRLYKAATNDGTIIDVSIQLRMKDINDRFTILMKNEQHNSPNTGIADVNTERAAQSASRTNENLSAKTMVAAK